MDVLRDNKKSDEINELFAMDEYTAQVDELALRETEAILALPRLVKAAKIPLQSAPLPLNCGHAQYQ
jgi:hypothetical protein